MGCCTVDVNNTSPPSEKAPVKKEATIEKENLTSLSTTSGDFSKQYTLGKPLGKGQYGETWEGTHIPTKQKRAVKVIKKAALDNVQINQNDIMSEYNVLKKLDHPNIMKVYDSFLEPSTIYIPMEYMTGGTLSHRLTTLKRPFTEKECANIIKQILSGLSYCHGKNFAHRDIKLENIMFAGPDMNSPCKLIDFGFATRFAPQKGFSELLGSPMYMPPQIVTGNAYNEKCDIWSLGIVLYYLLTGKFPYRATNFKDLQAEISQSRFPPEYFKDIKGFSDVGKSFLSKMLTFGEKERASASQLLSDPWLTQDIQQVDISEADKNEIYSNMMKTKNTHLLQRTALQYISLNCEMNSESAKLGNLFRSLDKNGTGKLSKQQLKEGVKKMKNFDLPDNELNALFDRIDTNKDNQIQYTEFISGTMSKKIATSEDNLRTAFNFFDKNNNGRISSTELITIFQGNYREKQADMEKMIQTFDSDKSKELTFSEFKDMMLSIFK